MSTTTKHHIPPWAKDESCLHNPDKLTPEQVGACHRLLLSEEVDGRHRNGRGLEWWSRCFGGSGGNGVGWASDESCCYGNSMVETLRVPLAVPWPPPPSEGPKTAGDLEWTKDKFNEWWMTSSAAANIHFDDRPMMELAFNGGMKAAIAHHEASKEKEATGIPSVECPSVEECRSIAYGIWNNLSPAGSLSKMYQAVERVREVMLVWSRGSFSRGVAVGTSSYHEDGKDKGIIELIDERDEWKSRAESAEAKLASLQTKHDVACQTISQLQNERMHRDSFTALSNLSAWLSQGAGDETTTPDEYEGRIRAGVDQIIGVEVQRREEAEAKLAQSPWIRLRDDIIRNLPDLRRVTCERYKCKHSTDPVGASWSSSLCPIHTALKILEEIASPPTSDAQKDEKPSVPKFKVGDQVRYGFQKSYAGEITEVHADSKTYSVRDGATCSGWKESELELEPTPPTAGKRVPWDSTHDMPKVGSLWLRSKDDYRDHLVIGVANPCAIIMATCGSGPVIQSERFSDMRWDVMEWSPDRENWQPCSKEAPPNP